MKLKKLRVKGQLLDWIAEFLKDRFQNVRVNGTLSEPTLVKSGVPQGLVLGPILFLVYMIDLGYDLNEIHNHILKYIDDSKIFLDGNMKMTY